MAKCGLVCSFALFWQYVLSSVGADWQNVCFWEGVNFRPNLCKGG